MHVVDSLVVGPGCTGQAVKRQNGELLTGRAMWSRGQPQAFARARATSPEANVGWRRALKRPSGDPCPLCCQQIIPPPTALGAPAQVVNRPNLDDNLCCQLESHLMLARNLGPRRVLLQIACAALRVAYRSELPGHRRLQTVLRPSSLSRADFF